MESTDWQISLSTLKERVEYAFKNSLFCDVEFSIKDEAGSKVVVPANKFMLASASPVFSAMFYGHLAEKTSPIDLPDCSKEGIYEMLRYVHCDEVSLTEKNIVEVLYVAQKYMMPFLVERCREYINKHLKSVQVFSVLPRLKEIGDKCAEERCWEIIDCETLAAVTSESFLHLTKDTLWEVLTRDKLMIKEIDLFIAVYKWVIRKLEEKGLENCGKTKRDVLGEDVIRLIRFPVMSHKEFAQFVLPTEILTMKEVIEITQLMSCVETTTCMFSSKERTTCHLKTELRFVSFNSPACGRWCYDGKRVDLLDFLVNKNVYLAGVELFGSKASSYSVQLDLCSDSELISSVNVTVMTQKKKVRTKRYYAFEAYFERPVKLLEGCRYTVKATIKGPNSYYGVSGRTKMFCDDDLVLEFMDNKNSLDDCQTCTCLEKGQFSKFIFTRHL